MSEAITVKDLCLWYGNAQALKNVNISISEKSITALIGPSGCGKSTFLKTTLMSLTRSSTWTCMEHRVLSSSPQPVLMRSVRTKMAMKLCLFLMPSLSSTPPAVCSTSSILGTQRDLKTLSSRSSSWAALLILILLNSSSRNMVSVIRSSHLIPTA